MQELTMYQYSVNTGEKAILKAKIIGNAVVKPGSPMKPVGPNRWECLVGTKNIVFPVLVTFLSSAPESRVDLTIDGEDGDGPFAVSPILPTSAIKDPEFQLFTT